MPEFPHNQRPIFFQKSAANAEGETVSGAFKRFRSGAFFGRQVTIGDCFRNEDAQYSRRVESIPPAVGACDDLTSESVFHFLRKSGPVGKEMARIGVKERREHKCAEKIC